MTDNPVHSILQTALNNVDGMLDANTTIGKPIETPDGTVVIPVSKISYGFVTGGTEWSSGTGGAFPFGGGIGGGATITPAAFLILSKTGTQLISLDTSKDMTTRLLELAPSLLNHVKGWLERTDAPEQPQ